eukprot:TRINITY_DN63565_c0_g1_i1.p1 TRINITY_DN63565_c0_g1~~TRINITY_DN63565_c0_g1_i1.p1  ORF type:complete len:387 (+),score=56.49 TRINITY_DN63565_c0_g1_i1:139-1161(+)
MAIEGPRAQSSDSAQATCAQRLSGSGERTSLGHVTSLDSAPTLARGPMPSDFLSILSWNLLNPDTRGLATKDNPHYDHLTDEERFWEHRWPKIFDEIRLADTAVVCLQEINKDLYEEIKGALAALGYACVTHKKMQRNSLAIFFKQERLSKVWEKNVKVKGMEKTVAVGLEDAGQIIAVVTCHLEGHPEKAVDRIKQLEATFSEIKDLPHQALIVAGDFNAPLVEEGRYAAVASYMSAGNVPAGMTEWGKKVCVDADTQHDHGYTFSSAYQSDHVFSISLHGERPALIDHIWYTSQSLELTAVRDVFFKDDFRQKASQHGLPNLQNPSDHLPLGVVLKWK